MLCRIGISTSELSVCVCFNNSRVRSHEPKEVEGLVQIVTKCWTLSKCNNIQLAAHKSMLVTGIYFCNGHYCSMKLELDFLAAKMDYIFFWMKKYFQSVVWNFVFIAVGEQSNLMWHLEVYTQVHTYMYTACFIVCLINYI